MPHDPITRALQRTDMSRRAKGLLLEILTSDNPNLTTQNLIDAGTEGRAAVTSMLHELEALGYARREQAREGYRFGPVQIVLADDLVEWRNQ